MSDSYRLTIDVQAGDKRGLALLLHLQQLGLPWAIERLPDAPSEVDLRPYRRAGGEPLEEVETEAHTCALDELIAAHRLNPEG